MNCRDCIHFDVCDYCEMTVENPYLCDFFKDRSRFVKLSHAEWVEDEDICDYLIYRCSNCNDRFVLEEGTPLDNCYFYCPYCGAKMDEQALKERESNA